MTAIPRRRAASGSCLAARPPPTSRRPSSGAIAPARILISVDLPAPFSPTIAWTSPASTSNDTPRRARMPAYAFESPAAVRTAVPRRPADGTPGEAIVCALRQELLDDVAVDVSETEVAALELVR